MLGPNNLQQRPSAMARKESRRPKYSKFTQQELPACKPLLTPIWIVSIFLMVGILFIPIGVVTLLASRSVVEIVLQYENDCLPSNLTNNSLILSYIQDERTNKTCSKQLKVPQYMKQPVYIYYQLENYYQNHRRYVKSRSDKQLLSGRGASATDTDSCKPEQQANNNLTIIPCGLISWSLFNDTYNFSLGGKQLPVNTKGISWESDRKHKFGNVTPDNFPNNIGNGSLIGGAKLDPNKSLNEDENLIVWMRTAALPTFRKLYGKIEQDLQAESMINVMIDNVYNTYSFGGRKKLVLSTTNWLGGKNDFLGITYITVGSICVFFAITFFLFHLANPRPAGDPQYLSWNKKGARRNAPS